jgi:pilus assembly protein HofP
LCSRWRAMMAAKRIAASCLLVLMLAGMRDPFKPPPDRCMVSQLALWHYQGVVSRLRPRQGLCAIPPGDGDACRRGNACGRLARGGI